MLDLHNCGIFMQNLQAKFRPYMKQILLRYLV